LLCLGLPLTVSKASQITKVSIGGNNSSFGYYNVSPESPNGKRLGYVLIPANSRHDMELWICDINLKNHQKIATIQNIGVHNGASSLWVNDKTIAYMDGYARLKIIDVDTKATRFTFKQGRLGLNNNGNNILFASLIDESELASTGLFMINTDSGSKKLVVSYEELRAFHLKFRTGDDKYLLSSLWNHQFSPDGQQVVFRANALNADGYEESYLVSVDNEKKIAMFSPTPLHFIWFDNDTFIGFNKVKGENRLLKWSKTGAVLEIISGSGNHIALSSDKSMLAAETIYQKSPIELNIFKRGEIEPVSKIFSHKYSTATWDEKYHVNPSFSKDGKRLYFNHAVSANNVFASFIQINKHQK
jgi:hypothetical protein